MYVFSYLIKRPFFETFCTGTLHMRKFDILDKDEQQIFDAPPKFTQSEQKIYFTLPDEIANWTKTIIIPSYLVGFVLLWGYAKSKYTFFSPKQFLEFDIQFVCNHLGVDISTVDFNAYNQRTYSYHKQIIRKYLQIKPFDKTATQFFIEAIKDKVAKHQSPKQILYEVVQICVKHRIEVPSYNRFRSTISSELSRFEINLTNIIKSSITQTQKNILAELIKADNSNNYQLTQLKTISHERNPSSIRESVKDFQIVKNTYTVVLPLIIQLSLHTDTIKYFGTWVRKASNFQIQQLNENKRYLYLMCFIDSQYCFRQDFLADILLLSVRSTENKVHKSEKESSHQNNGLHSQTIKLLSNSRISYKELVKKIDSIIKSATIPDAEKIIQIDQLLLEYRNQQPQEETLESIINQNLEEISSVDYYTILEDESLKLQNRVADIMRHLEFEENDTDIYKAIAHYQSKQGNITKTAPINFMSIKDHEQLSDEGKFRKSLYKSLLYSYSAAALKSGIISLKPSYRYLSLENYLYPYEKWQKYKNELLEEAQLSDKQDISQLLEQFKQEVDNHYNRTNQSIKKNNNPHVKFDTNNKLVLATPKVEKPDTKSVSSLFTGCKYVPILKILTDIQQVVDYLECLRHLSVKDKQVLPSVQVFYAALLGLGCNIGISKMANVSRGISEDILANLVNWHLSVSNLRLANQKILKLLEKLTITHIKCKDKVLHTSSDGRKIKVAVDSLNANASYKYFGKDMGIVNYSFIDNLDRLLYATAISSAERESTYVIDGITYDSSIKSDMHSTDTHGYSEVIFAIMYLLGIDFAPRIKNLKRAILYSFKLRNQYEALGYKVLPSRYFNEKLIIEQWDNILRLITTIKLKEVSASQIFKRLNSYSKQHPLYCALKEFGRIIKTIFILRYIDDVELRQSIEKQLNKIELSNKFAKAVSFDNNNEMQYSNKEEQEMVINCQVLIQNSIVLWNELYLSQKLVDTYDLIERAEILEILGNGSIQSWGHINFSGEYDFTETVDLMQSIFDMDKILELTL